MSKKGKLVQLNTLQSIYVPNSISDADARKKARAIFRQRYKYQAFFLGAHIVSNKIENV